jgi:hypothetical protein
MTREKLREMARDVTPLAFVQVLATLDPTEPLGWVVEYAKVIIAPLVAERLKGAPLPNEAARVSPMAKQAAHVLAGILDQAIARPEITMLIAEKYPFHRSLDEIIDDIGKWSDELWRRGL